MRVVILPTADQVAVFVATMIADIVRRQPQAVLGLATGSTPLGAYRHLIDIYRTTHLSFRGVTTFNLDEYVGLSPAHASSYRRFMEENLFQHLDLPSEQTHLPRGDAADLDQECLHYEEMIRDRGGIDCQLLGIGTDGHIGFNEPGSSLGSRTRVKTLTHQTRLDNQRFFDTYDAVPRSAITMGIGTILASRQIILVATGQGKSEAIRGAVEGPLTSSLPASALQLHPSATVVVDEAASLQLDRAEYYQQSEAERRRLRNEL